MAYSQIVKVLTSFVIFVSLQIAVIVFSELVPSLDLITILAALVSSGIALLVTILVALSYIRKQQWYKLFVILMLPLSIWFVCFFYYSIHSNIKKFHYRVLFNFSKKYYLNEINKLPNNKQRYKLFYLTGWGQLELNNDVYVAYDEQDSVINIIRQGQPTKEIPGGICQTDSLGNHFYILQSCTY